MKVLFIAHEDSKFGAPKSLMELIVTLKTNYDIEPIVLLHSKDDIYFFCEKNGIEKYIVGHRNFVCGRKNSMLSYVKYFPKKILNYVDDYRAIRLIEKKIDMKTIDIIHSNVSIISLGLKLRKKYNCKHIMHLRESADYLNMYVITLKNYIKVLNQYVDCFVAISNYNLRTWINRGIDNSKTEVIYNGLKMNLDYDIEKKSPSSNIKILFTGAIREEKGQHLLIEALEKLPDSCLNCIEVDFYGDGDKKYIKQLKKMISENNLGNRVHINGYTDQMDNLYSNYEIGVVASKGEAFGRVTIEYMENGLCVIASKAGANPEIVTDGVDGLLFENNREDLVRKLMLAIQNEEYRRSIQKKAKQRAKDFFSTEVNANNIYELYKRILKQNGTNTQ